jgi:hypothetical protein
VTHPPEEKEPLEKETRQMSLTPPILEETQSRENPALIVL